VIGPKTGFDDQEKYDAGVLGVVDGADRKNLTAATNPPNSSTASPARNVLNGRLTLGENMRQTWPAARCTGRLPSVS
jgi:hypothetical protein